MVIKDEESTTRHSYVFTQGIVCENCSLFAVLGTVKQIVVLIHIKNHEDC